MHASSHRSRLTSLLAAAMLFTVPASAQAVFVVRHAEKASETERDPVLSAAGEARAAALDSALADVRIAAIIVTPYHRTRATAAVVARRHGITPIEVPVGGGGVAAHAQAVATEAARHQGSGWGEASAWVPPNGSYLWTVHPSLNSKLTGWIPSQVRMSAIADFGGGFHAHLPIVDDHH